MSATFRAKKRIFKYLIQKKWASLKSAPPDELIRRSRTLAMQAFHRAAKRSPAYVKFLARHNVRKEDIRSFFDFTQKVPPLDKKGLFQCFDMADIVPRMLRDPAGRVWASSGSSGIFSFGFEAPDLLKKASLPLDFMLHNLYGILDKKTLIINAIPNPWPISSGYAHCADVGTRYDLAVSLLPKMSSVYEQFILGTEPLLAKKILEEAVKAGLDLSRFRLKLIIGGEYVSEHLRQYLQKLLNGDKSPASAESSDAVLSTMGLSELGLGVFFELPALASIRRKIAKSPDDFGELIGPDRRFCPQLLQYVPSSTFVETATTEDGKTRLLLTDLRPDAPFPFVRYDTGDTARTVSFHDFVSKLAPYLSKQDLNGIFPFPVVLISGKTGDVPLEDGSMLDINEAKEIFFSFHDLLPQLTGLFHLAPKKPGAVPTMKIQMKPETAAADLPASAFSNLRHIAKTRGFEIEPVLYKDFPVSVGLSFEKKFKYS